MKHYTATSRQEMFNNVWKHYITEGNPRGYDEEQDSCVYRGQTYVGGDSIEVACAIGIHLPDEYANSLYLSDVVKDLLRHEEGKALLVGDIDEPFLTDLQSHHDGMREPFNNTTLEERLRSFAKLHNLTIPEDTHADHSTTSTLQ